MEGGFLGGLGLIGFELRTRGALEWWVCSYNLYIVAYLI